jgi:SNF2 family DNA or RNA helicase
LLTLLKPGIFKTLREFRAAYMVPGNSRQPANPDRLRELMRSVMIRNTRAVVALKLPRRHAATVRVEAGAAEASAYRELVTALRVASSEGKERLAVANLLGAAGSSPRAAAEALARFTQKRANEGQWQALAEQWSAVDAAGKERALLDILRRNPGEKKIVFVHYRATLERLADVLSREAIAFVRFDGSMSGPDKDAAIGEFRVRADVLLCTESGGEGRNIQFCNTLVNYDVPWNPMAIEQRIGRIDRIGQTREVFVFNLATQGTIEDEILKLLDEKIAMFELVVGEAGAILGQVEDSEGEFSSLVLDAWLAESEGARATALESLGQRLMEARTRHEGAKSLDETLFGEEFETT